MSASDDQQGGRTTEPPFARRRSALKVMEEIIPRRMTLDLAGVAIAAVAIIALFLRANLRFDNSWDGTAHHLVFAAFRAGILTLDDLTPIKHLQDFYDGFPPILDLVRAYTWRITGSILILQNFDLVASCNHSASAGADCR